MFALPSASTVSVFASHILIGHLRSLDENNANILVKLLCLQARLDCAIDRQLEMSSPRAYATRD